MAGHGPSDAERWPEVSRPRFTAARSVPSGTCRPTRAILEELEGRLLLSGLDELPGSIVPPSADYRALLVQRNGELVISDATLASGAELDYYVLRPDTGGAFTIATTGGVNTVMGLYSATRTLLTSNDNRGGGDLNAEIAATLDSNTVYWVLVTGYGPSAGAYGLAVTGPDQALAATVRTDPPTFSRVAIGSISPQHDVDYWAIVAPDGAASLSLILEKGSTGNIDGYLRLEDAAGTVLGQANAGGAGAAQRIDSAPVSGGQTYYATVAGWGGTIGAYSMTSTFVVRCTVQSVEITLDPDDSQSIETGGVVRGSGTIRGGGWGTVRYRWVVQKPGGAVWTSEVLSTLLSGGSAAVASFDEFPTADSGRHRVWIRIESPNGPDDTLSQQKTYAVNIPTVTFSGTAAYRDGAVEPATWKPLRNVEVSLLDFNHNVVATTRTAQDGAFSFPTFSTDSGSQFRLRVAARSSAAEVRDGTTVYQYLSPFQTVHLSGDYALDVQIDTADEAGAWNILDNIISARDYLVAGGLVTASHIDGAVVNWTPLGTCEAVSDQEVSILDGTEFADGVVLHQYSHYVAAKMGFANDGPGGTHYVNKPAGFAQPVLSAYQREALGFAEGWASFLSSVVLFSAGAPGGEVEVPSANVYGDTGGAFAAVRPEDGNIYTVTGDRTSLAAFADVTGSDSELAVWGVLWDLFDQDQDEAQGLDAVWADSPLANPPGKPAGWASDPFSAPGAFGTIWNVLAASKAKTISQFWNAWLDASVAPTCWPDRAETTEAAWRVLASRRVGVTINDGSAPAAAPGNPSPGAVVNQETINSRGYIDIDFSDSGGSGLNHASIIDTGPEFRLSGAGAGGVVIDGSPMLVSGTVGTYRYWFTGSFGIGVIQVAFQAGSWTDNAGNPGSAGAASFVVAPSEPIVSYSITFTDPAGQAITAVRCGQEFKAVVWVDDLRGSGAAGGVRAGYVDLDCDAAAQWLPGTIVYGPGFDAATAGSVSADGITIDEAGAHRGDQLPPPGDAPQVLFTVTGRVQSSITASAVGFRLGPGDDTPAHDTWLYGSAEGLPTAALTFGEGRLAVMSGYHNAARPSDVNDNGTVEPQDALILVNKLNAEGPHLLAAPQDAYPTAGAGMFWDVNVDDWVTPLDALNVINEINSSYVMAAPPPQGEPVCGASSGPQAAMKCGLETSLACPAPPPYTVRYVLSVTDPSGQPISTIQAGSDFQLRCGVQDLRAVPQGVFAGYADVTYAGPVQPTGAFSYGSDYPNGHSGSTATVGMLDEVGGFDGFTTLDGLPHLLFAMTFHATGGGTVTFNADPADVIPAHQTLVFGSNLPVPTGEIEFIQTSITVTSPQPVLTLTIAPESFSEAAGASAAVGTVVRSGPVDSALAVSLAGSNASEATVPPTVTIEAGKASADFAVSAVDDTAADGTQFVTFTASATGFVSAAKQVSVTDNDVAVPLAITLSVWPGSFSEASGSAAATATVTRTGPVDSPLLVSLASSDATEAAVPATVTIEAGQASADFTVSAVDDATIDGAQDVTITASAGGYTSGAVHVSVTDNDQPAPADLVLYALGYPAGAHYPGDAFTLSFTLANQGATSVAPSKAIALDAHLSANEVWGDADDLTICTGSDTGGLAAGTARQVNLSCAIPQSAQPGDYYLIAAVNGNGAVAESDTTNNRCRSPSRDVTIVANDYDDYADPGQWADAGLIQVDPGTGEGEVDGRIEQPSDGDLFKFVAPQGGAAKIVVLPSAGNVAPAVRIYDAAGVPIPCNDRDAGTGFRAWVDLDAAQTYYVEVAGGGGVGTYEITVDTTPTPGLRLGKAAGLPAAGYITGPDGQRVTITYAGPGVAEVFLPGPGQGIEAIQVNGSTQKSALTIKTPNRTSRTAVGDVFIHGAVRSLAGVTADLTGRLEVEGSLGKCVLGDVVNSEIHIGPRPAGDEKTQANITLGRVRDLSIVSQTPIKSIRAIEWLDTDSTEDVIQAPWVGSIAITGRKAKAKAGLSALAGDMAAGVMLTDASRKQTLAKATVAGSMLKGNWQIAGNLGTLTLGAAASAWSVHVGGCVKRIDSRGDLGGSWAIAGSLGSLKVRGTADHARIQTSGAIGSVILGASDGSDFLAGVAGNNRHAEARTDFNPAAGIKSIKITGLKTPKGTPLGRFMKDTNISAATLGKASLVNAELTGNGIYVMWQAAGGEIRSVRHRDTQYPENNWSYPPEGLQTGPDMIHFL